MIVSEGKSYMDATGRKLGPAKSAPPENCGYDFVLGGYPYTSDGKCGYISGGVRMCPAEYLDLIAEWTDEPQTGTLADLNVKPGDVVEWDWGGRPIKYTIGRVGCCGDYYEENDMRSPLSSNEPHWRIISRASTTQSPVRTVTRKEIVPGVYGQIRVYDEPCEKGHVCLGSNKVAHHWTADELTAAIETLTAIKEALS